jgi:hypothetical protein
MPHPVKWSKIAPRGRDCENLPEGDSTVSRTGEMLTGGRKPKYTLAYEVINM